MIHLITITGKSARNFYLEERRIPDLKALFRTVCCGRVLLISTRFRSDLFYSSRRPRNTELLTLWALYANTHLTELDTNDLTTSKGIDHSLTWYFQSINTLSTHWFRYRKYREAFEKTFFNDPKNPVAKTVMECDQFLTEHPTITRSPLLVQPEKTISKVRKDTFALAMDILRRESHSN